MTERRPEVIDCQIHMWEADRPGRAWQMDFADRTGISATTGNKHVHAVPVTLDDSLKAMDAAGVDAALIVSPSLYGLDCSYALEAAAAHPDRFRVVGYVDHRAADVAAQVAAWAARPETAGLRMFLITDGTWSEFRAGAFDGMLAAMAHQGVPLCLCPAGHLDKVPELVRRFPDLSVAVDHLGLLQPPFKLDWERRFDQFPLLLDLAAMPNVTVKLSGLPTLSAGGYPYDDVRPYMDRLLRTFGPGRLMWGSDWTRCPPNVGYRDSVRFVTESNELSPDEQALILGATLRRVFNWPRAS
jgi:L-fuconolactonase